MQRLIFIFLTLSILTHISSIKAQNTFLANDDKNIQLYSSKLLKNGDIVLVEGFTDCRNANVRILKQDGEDEVIFTEGFPVYRSFLELPNNDWLLVLITDPSIDFEKEMSIHTILFTEDDYLIQTVEDGNTLIPLAHIRHSALIHSSQLMLASQSHAFFCDFTFNIADTKDLDNPLEFVKAPLPDEGHLYYKYESIDGIFSTEDRFETETLISFNLGDSFRAFHYLGDYAIFQDENEISAASGIFDFQYLEQDKKIYGFGQHGQNLKYYTLSADSIMTMNKIYLDESKTLQKESKDIDIKRFEDPPQIHWDAHFIGISYIFNPLPRPMYDDGGSSYNYVLDYALEGNNLETQEHDFAIESTSFDVSNVEDHVLDIDFDLTVSNHGSEAINEFAILSNGYTGVECFDDTFYKNITDINLLPGESMTFSFTYPMYGFPDNDKNLCLYVLGANHKMDSNPEDNISCIPISQLTNTEDLTNSNEIRIYPNPARNDIRIALPNTKSTIVIYDLQGTLISSWNHGGAEDVIDISTLAPGMYILRDIHNNWSQKLMKI